MGQKDSHTSSPNTNNNKTNNNVSSFNEKIHHRECSQQQYQQHFFIIIDNVFLVRVLHLHDDEGRNSATKLRFSTFAQHNFNDDAHHHHHHRHHHRQQKRVTTMIKKSGGNSYYRASPILKMSASDNNITSDLIESMRVNIREQLEAESVEVMDLSGNGRHVAIKVVSEKFEGKSAVNRQRMVYKAIWMELQDQVHAVNEMVTNTPEEEKKENP